MLEPEQLSKEKAEEAGAIAQIQETPGYQRIMEVIQVMIDQNNLTPEEYHSSPDMVPMHVGARAALQTLRNYFEDLLTIANNPIYEREPTTGGTTGGDFSDT